ncbi:phosphonate metabolism transcriptional regulator PhnF [Thiothrix subterranea]|uniref:Phosphonate metabolism transcriptional regulator PhnF n=1 Tax=Thiothrix subterranea TaxID=2735563 RepID=A0AA51MM54_9GAMM|nr:phosphonate metabolism transcriptional regulator PhnF [Thiothrix subterranea]MDQ5768721.1 phosphonate metabolism transcriptional regulator PhnF [Thiothrix subterranea]WML84872.1 phosphonate metabolism transcriptional regulator PhnF [Thiothrix subterranea]
MTVSLITRQQGQALYAQISQMLETDIARNYEAGDYLPAEQVLAERFGVNRHTLRRAVDELVDKGLVERQHGKGICVVERALDYAINQRTRFTETLAPSGKPTATQLLHKQQGSAQGGVARRLQLAEGTPIILLETLRLVDGTPFCVVSHFLPQAGLEALLERYTGGSLHSFLAECCGLQLQRTESLVTAMLPQGLDAHYLKMPRNQPVLRVKSLNIDIATGKVIEYALTRFRADRVQLSLQP